MEKESEKSQAEEKDKFMQIMGIKDDKDLKEFLKAYQEAQDEAVETFYVL
jgi:succinate dehydrogenase flavin-adding protein (antitoxin of CptAB toxin-antitoxin module)